MEFFNTIIQILTTPNEGVTNIICAPLVIVEMYISMLLFTSILNIKTTKKQKLIYVMLTSSFCIINRFIIPNPYSTILNLLISPFLVLFLFRSGILKSIIAQIIPFVVSVLVETLISKFYFLCFDASFYEAVYTPLLRLLIMLFIYVLSLSFLNSLNNSMSTLSFQRHSA